MYDVQQVLGVPLYMNVRMYLGWKWSCECCKSRLAQLQNRNTWRGEDCGHTVSTTNLTLVATNLGTTVSLLVQHWYNPVTALSQPCHNLSQPCHYPVTTCHNPVTEPWYNPVTTCHSPVTALVQPCHNLSQPVTKNIDRVVPRLWQVYFS